MNKLFQIQAPNYKTEITPLDQGLLCIERLHQWTHKQTETDVFGQCWSFAWSDFTDNEVGVRVHNHDYFINGLGALLIPPFSQIQWIFKKKEIHWKALISDLPIWDLQPSLSTSKHWMDISRQLKFLVPSHLYGEALFYRRSEIDVMPKSVEEMIAFLKSHLPLRVISQNKAESVVASRTRQHMIQHLNEEFSIHDMAEALGFDVSLMSREFKKAFNISPLQFRNRMRVLDSAHRLMLEPTRVADMAFAVGFSGLENYHKQFKKIMNLTPSHFRILL